MLIGAHVSTAGGLHNAVARGAALGCEAVQVFNQSPRMWRPTAYGDEDFSAFNDAIAQSSIGAAVIHAVYLVNCASAEAGVRRKSLASVTQSLRVGAAIGARGVILHPGSAKTGDVARAIKRAGKTIAAALADSERCDLHLENTAGAGGTLGRSVDELAALIDAAGGDERLGVCLDSCHLLASGYDIRTRAGVDALIAEVSAKIGLARVRSLHLNDSQTPLGSNRDRHANVGAGEIGERGCASFLGARAFDRLPCVLETPGEGDGPTVAELELARKLRARGVRARTRTQRTTTSRAAPRARREGR
jgi:deoxyribonuclease IV